VRRHEHAARSAANDRGGEIARGEPARGEKARHRPSSQSHLANPWVPSTIFPDGSAIRGRLQQLTDSARLPEPFTTTSDKIRVITSATKLNRLRRCDVERSLLNENSPRLQIPVAIVFSHSTVAAECEQVDRTGSHLCTARRVVAVLVCEAHALIGRPVFRGSGSHEAPGPGYARPGGWHHRPPGSGPPSGPCGEPG